MHLELHSKGKRRNSRISSPCLGVLPVSYQKESPRKAFQELQLVQTCCSPRQASGAACKTATMISAHFLCALGILQSIHRHLQRFIWLPLAVQEISSLISLALAAVTSWYNFSISLLVAGFMQKRKRSHFIPKFTLPMKQLSQNLLNFYI